MADGICQHFSLRMDHWPLCKLPLWLFSFGFSFSLGPDENRRTCWKLVLSKFSILYMRNYQITYGNFTLWHLVSRMAISHCTDIYWSRMAISLVVATDWHLVVKNGNFTLLLTWDVVKNGQFQFQIAETDESRYTLPVLSDCQAWQFHFATDM